MELQKLIDMLENLKQSTDETKVFIATDPWTHYKVNGCYFDKEEGKIFLH